MNVNSRVDRPGTSRSTQFALTLLSDVPLSHRLLAELGFLISRFKKRWPDFKEDPVGVIKAEASHLGQILKHAFSRPQVAAGLATSIMVVLSAILIVALLDQRPANRAQEDEPDDLQVVTTINFPETLDNKSDPGIGAGEKGRVGFERGRGEGSRPEAARSRGGGGGGDGSRLPSSQGRIPTPSEIPAPIPTAAVRFPQALPVAGIDLDPALWRKLDYSSYGDPRSKSKTPSNGSGDDGGVGTGKGTGIGEGEGDGFGPGRDGNIGGGSKETGGGDRGGSRGNNPNDDKDRVYRSPEVSTRPRVIAKPEPQYTEQARRDQVTGTVVLRVVFSSSGQVTNINAVQKLGGGLTEKAIAAARQIRFLPAMRNGQPVSMYMQLEYNFNLY
ncbi:MAG TPA: energy transducer TonB [Pyrinomonadaceae bacterium]|nr:energy transducer TonB [Pyrinomonadaceae bacterium]